MHFTSRPVFNPFRTWLSAAALTLSMASCGGDSGSEAETTDTDPNACQCRDATDCVSSSSQEIWACNDCRCELTNPEILEDPSDCESFGAGEWANCLELGGSAAEACGREDASCLFNTAQDLSVCSATCESVCDCPAAPATGTAVQQCASGIISETDERTCILSCAAGETCPDGMECVSAGPGALCIHTVEPPEPTGDPIEIYGDCVNQEGVCQGEAAGCAQFSASPVFAAACSDECETADECPQPTSGEAQPECRESVSDASLCYLDCFDGETCPDGMFCIPFATDAYGCAWLEGRPYEPEGTGSGSSSSGSTGSSSSTTDGESSGESSSTGTPDMLDRRNQPQTLLMRR